MARQNLHISTSPFLKDKATTPWIMYQVVYAMIPLVLAAYYLFGLGSLAVIITATLGALVTEYIFRRDTGPNTLVDGSALITGILLGLTLPPGFPLWMAFLGGIVAIGMGKVIWGGLGQNIFNPALLGRAFLQAAFPTAITTWSIPDGRYFEFRGTNMALPLMQGHNVDAVSSATPLAQMKFDKVSTGLDQLLLGDIAGSIGETSGVLILMAGAYLLLRRIINWRIPVGILVTVAVFSGIFYLINPAIYPSPWFMIASGGLLLGTFFMATDLVTSPITPKGIWIFSIGVGILVVLIRVWGGLPEGVMYAILLMNAATPLINRYTKIRTYGYPK